jgi:hypothetical protein
MAEQETFGRLSALGRLFSVADRVVPDSMRPGLAAGALVRAAGVPVSDAAREGLERLMAALAAESELTLFGQVSVRYDMIRLLRNAAMVEAAHAADPALAARPVAGPIFILGLPRSGTSFLHTLLAEDPANAVPRQWQTIHPGPRPAGFDPKADKRVRAVDRQLRIFAGMAPGFAQLHPISGDSPQECSEMTAHVFQSLRFDTVFRVPGYFAWLEQKGHAAAFRFHKRFLQVLQGGDPARWVLKCPDHTFCLDAILQVYPDARFIMVHRDPLAVLASNARLTEVLRRPFLRRVDAGELGRQESARWLDGAARLLAFDKRADVPADRKFHLRHADLIADPLVAVRDIYRHFGLALAAPAAAAMHAMVAARPHGGYARHKPYTLERFQMSAAALTPGFAPYVAAFC